MADVLLDPSILVPARLERVTEVVKRLQAEGSPAYVPGTFYGLIRERELSIATFNALHGRGVRRGSEGAARQNGRGELRARGEIDAVRSWVERTEVIPF